MDIKEIRTNEISGLFSVLMNWCLLLTKKCELRLELFFSHHLLLDYVFVDVKFLSEEYVS